MDFSADDPFPCLSRELYTYPEAQLHSEKVDQWLGLRTDETERAILANDDYVRIEEQGEQRLWIGLPVQTLLTPYLEIRTLLQDLNPKPGDLLVDLGAGYGRIGFVLARHYPGVQFLGFEYVKERVMEACRCGVRLEQADLFSPNFLLPWAETYFIYDYGSRQAVSRTLENLKACSRKKAIQVVGRGRLTRDLIEREHPWLSQVNEPQHRGNYSIYRS